MANSLRRVLASAAARRVGANFSFLVVLQVVDKFVPFILIPYLVYTLGFGKWGVLSFAQSFGLYFLIVMDYGFAQTATRDVAQNRERPDQINKIVSQVFAAKALLCILAVAVGLCIAALVPRFSADFVLFAGSLALYAAQSLFPLWFFQGMERMGPSTIVSSITRLLFLLLILVFVRNPGDIVKVLPLQALGVALSVVVAMAIMRFRFGIRLVRVAFPDVRAQLAAGFPIFVGNLSISLYTTTRNFLSGALSPEVVAACFYLADKLVSFMGIPFGMFAQAVYPRLAQLASDDATRFHRLLRNLLRGATVYGAALLGLGYLFGPSLLWLLSNGSFNPLSVVFFQILVLALPIIHMNTFRIQGILIGAFTRTYLQIHLVGGIFGVALLFTLGTTLGTTGLCWAAVVTELGILCLSTFMVHRLRRPS